MIRTLIAATIALSLALPITLSAADAQFLDAKGNEISRTRALGKSYALVLLAKPWDGLTKDLLEQWEKYGRSFQGRVRPVVFFVDSKRATVNKFMEDKRHTFRWFIDEKSVLLEELNPPLLPFAVLLSPKGEILYRTVALRDDFMRLIASNPGRALRELKRIREGGLPLVRPIPDHGPWGPPKPKDPILGDETK